MKNKIKVFGLIAIVLISTLSATSCSGQSGGGGKSINSAEELKAYLDKQPVNGPDKPIKISITSNAPMLKSFAKVIESSGKYVSLNITGNALTEIPEEAFDECTALVGITIPDSVTIIKDSAFWGCTGLTSVTIPDSVTSIGRTTFANCTGLTGVTFQGTISSNNFAYGRFPSFDGDLCYKYLAGGIGTYIVTEKDRDGDPVWTKK